MPVLGEGFCCGCAACAQACSRDAIRMIEDECGFFYPQIDAEKCVECGKCEAICRRAHGGKQPSDVYPQKAYAYKHNENEVLLQSSSGGAFTALSDAVLAAGGVVCGAVMDAQYRVYHTMATDVAGRDAMRGSKYVQSETAEVYPAIGTALQQGKQVLFVGTPCQCAVVRALFESENLLCCDFMCHGVASRKLFLEYLDWERQRRAGRITGYRFRSKNRGWSVQQTVCYASGREDSASLHSQMFMTAFLSDYFLRPSCYQCGYARQSRSSDITIADFWGLRDVLPEFFDNRGVSLILTNSARGERLMQAAKSDGVWREVMVPDALHIQRASQMPAPIPNDAEQIRNDYAEQGFDYMVRKHMQYSEKANIQYILRNEYNLRSILKKMGVLPMLSKVKQAIKRGIARGN